MCNLFRSRKRRVIRFYKEDERWYADIAGIPKEDNEMIENSVELLNSLCNTFKKKRDEIYITVSEQIGSSMIRLKMLNIDDEGCTYTVDGGLFAEYFNLLGTTIWICNVAKLVFGRFPPYIYVLSVSGTRPLFSKVKRMR